MQIVIDRARHTGSDGSASCAALQARPLSLCLHRPLAMSSPALRTFHSSLPASQTACWQAARSGHTNPPPTHRMQTKTETGGPPSAGCAHERLPRSPRPPARSHGPRSTTPPLPKMAGDIDNAHLRSQILLHSPELLFSIDLRQSTRRDSTSCEPVKICRNKPPSAVTRSPTPSDP